MLKTLNDFNKKYNFEFGYFGNLMKIFNLDEDCASETNHVLCHFVRDLKQEAIKWINDMKEKNDIEKLFPNPNELFYAIEKFKHFFNITEEDLK